MKNTQQSHEIVFRRLNLLGKELGKPELCSATEETHLMGAQSPLDSIGLVTLIADLEGDILEITGKSVTLADEKAMSLKVSPFRKVGTLIAHIECRCATSGSQSAL